MLVFANPVGHMTEADGDVVFEVVWRVVWQSLVLMLLHYGVGHAYELVQVAPRRLVVGRLAAETWWAQTRSRPL